MTARMTRHRSVIFVVRSSICFDPRDNASHSALGAASPGR